jgi:guanidinopropionase
MHVVPVLAEDYEVSPDAKQFTIRLKRGVEFHEGAELNGAAVKARFNRVINPENKLRRYVLFSHIQRTEAVDDYTVVDRHWARSRLLNAPPLARGKQSWGPAAVRSPALQLATACGHNRFGGELGARKAMFDDAKLAALRAKYTGRKETEVAPAEFKKALSLVFGQEYRRSMPYAGLSTLLDLPYRPEAPDQPDFAGLEVALVGVPMDLGVTNRAGARLGPRAVREVERIGPYNHPLKVAPRGECKAADIGDVPMRSRFSLDASIEDIAAFYTRIHKAGVRPISVGGDHSITYPILQALGRDRPVGLVHIDAHCDTMGEIEGSKFHHGGPFRQAVLAGVLDPERTIQIGIRGPAEVLWGFSYESGMTVLHIEDVDRLGIEGVVERARAVVSDGPTYISFDVDGLDPTFAPGTGTPEAGGLTPREAQAILHGLAGIDLVGGDVVEVAPQYDPTSNTAMVGAQMLFELFSLMVLGPNFRRGAR